MCYDTAMPDQHDEGSPTPPRSTHSEDGVDLTLIRWMLSLSPAERLLVLQENVAAILRLRRDQTQLSDHPENTPKRAG